MTSDLFYKICFSFSIFCSIISLLFGLLMLLIILLNNQCHTITNMITSNTIILTMIYSIVQLSTDIYGIQDTWFIHQPLCIFRSYCYTVVCISVPISYLIQSISRLFFSIFYKHKYLLTYRTHIYLIILNYLIALLGGLGPMYVPDGFGFEIESRTCLNSTKVFLSSFLAITIAYLIPLSIIIFIYGIIIYSANKSRNRVTNLNPNKTFRPNYKRELILMRNIFILIMILVIAGFPYLILVFWHLLFKHIKPPTPLYLLALISITMCFSTKMIVLFFMNKEIKNILLNFIQKYF
ncbi:hypothetical protein I4U23_017296 [Adineta vaga]|nr:hypothetical protein I4U23_017296 [Adineta vaga]